MSLSSNWKALSSKIAPKGAVTQEKRKKSKHVSMAKPLEKKGKNEEAEAAKKVEESTKLMSPLEHALWSTTKQDGAFQIEKFAGKKAVDFRDTRKKEPGRFVALDCEFVGVGDHASALARVSIVNYYGVVLLDTFVKPKERVTDWRTWVSGVGPKDMQHAISFKAAQSKVDELIRNRIVVGHALQNDMRSLALTLDRRKARDTSKFAKFRKLAKGGSPSLKKLCTILLNVNIQDGSHSSVEDARATMALYRLYQKEMDEGSH